MKTKQFSLLFFLCVFFELFSSCSNEESIIDVDTPSVIQMERVNQLDSKGYTGYYILLVEVDPDCKIRVIAKVKELFMYDMRTAKYLVESVPSYLAKVEDKTAADWYVAELVKVGAKVRLE